MSTRKKRKRQPLTLVLIPHGRKVINISIPFWALRTTAILGAAAVFLVVYLLYSNSVLRTNVSAMEELRQINEVQAKEINELAEQTQAVQLKVNEVESLEAEIYKLTGLKSQSSSQTESQPSRAAESRRSTVAPNLAGVNDIQGGTKVLASLKSDTIKLNGQLSDQAVRLAELKQAIQRRLNYLAALPDKWPVLGRLTSGFGMRKSPFSRKREFHDGIDIAVKRGTPIKAAGRGVVTFAGWKSGHGRLVIINHGNGYRTWYAHNSSLLVKRGQKVEKGQLISRAGSSGRSTGTHLHFIVEANGKTINPMKILSH